MNYMGDILWWNNRFKNRELRLMNPEEALIEDINLFPKGGKVLELACGDGRNAIFLSEHGYEVLAVDFSTTALERLSYFAKKKGLNIETKLLDLSKDNSFEDLLQFEVIIINHYRLNPSLYLRLMEKLKKKSGVLWVNGFREVPMDNLNIRESDVLREEDFEVLAGYKLINKKMYERGEKKFIRCCYSAMEN
ncbi:MAG: methyltransferase domain-containing protein [Romboutsia sp.]|nr:methyltransferase domain-containing protein [Romboutsia sp.]